MSRPISRIEDGTTRRALRDIDGRMLKLASKLDKINLQDVMKVASGGIRSGTSTDRGSAADNYPQMFFQWSSNEIKVYLTIPTSASGDFQWTKLFELEF